MNGLTELCHAHLIYTAGIDPGQLVPKLSGRLAKLKELLEPGYISLPTRNIPRSGFTTNLVPVMR